MIDHLGLGRLGVLLVVALLVFGPERLPGIASQVGRGLRQFRGTLDKLGSEVRRSVGPELADLRSLHPRAFLSDLMADEPEPVSVPVAPAADLPEGSDAMSLLEAPVDLSTVDTELAALSAPEPQPG